MMHNLLVRLQDIAQITAGHPIRGAVKTVPSGDVAVVQIKNVDINAGVDWPAVSRTKLSGRRDPDWLRTDDILFSARGQRNVAVCINEPPLKAVCSPHFFLVRIRKNKMVLPSFLAWQINLPPAQRYLAQSATGSYITSIRRQVLEQLPLVLPSLQQQLKLIRLALGAQREKFLMEKLIENRQRELQLLAAELLAQS